MPLLENRTKYEPHHITRSRGTFTEERRVVETRLFRGQVRSYNGGRPSHFCVRSVLAKSTIFSCVSVSHYLHHLNLSTPPVRFCVIGAGRGGLIHARNLAQRIRAADLVALCDADTNILNKAGSRVRRYPSARSWKWRGRRRRGGSVSRKDNILIAFAQPILSLVSTWPHRLYDSVSSEPDGPV